MAKKTVKKVIKMVVTGTMTYVYDAKTGKYIKGKDSFEQDDSGISFKDENGNFTEVDDEMLQKIFNN
jgi:hypothetical protein